MQDTFCPCRIGHWLLKGGHVLLFDLSLVCYMCTELSNTHAYSTIGPAMTPSILWHVICKCSSPLSHFHSFSFSGSSFSPHQWQHWQRSSTTTTKSSKASSSSPILPEPRPLFLAFSQQPRLSLSFTGTDRLLYSFPTRGLGLHKKSSLLALPVVAALSLSLDSENEIRKGRKKNGKEKLGTSSDSRLLRNGTADARTGRKCAYRHCLPLYTARAYQIG